MNRFLFITIFIFINTISLESDFNYETIVELVPKTFFFDGLNTDSFKIFQYIPSCEQSFNLYKKILLKVTSSENLFKDYKLYLYEEFKDIRQNENEEFINYQESYTNHLFYNLKKNIILFFLGFQMKPKIIIIENSYLK